MQIYMDSTNQENWRKIINRCDPAGLIAMGAPRGEYDMEIAEVIEAAQSCKSIDDLASAIHQIFFDTFGDITHDDFEKYRRSAEEAWTLLKKEDNATGP
jgi:hypothetical protein